MAFRSERPASTRMARKALRFACGVYINVPYTSKDNMCGLKLGGNFGSIDCFGWLTLTLILPGSEFSPKAAIALALAVPSLTRVERAGKGSFLMTCRAVYNAPMPLPD